MKLTWNLHVMLMNAGRPKNVYYQHKEDPWMRFFNVDIDNTVSNCQPDIPKSNEDGSTRQLMERD